MSALQRCPNPSEAVPLYIPQGLYLRPLAKLNISLQLPNQNMLGKSISHLEIIDKLRELIRPEEFSIIKVSKTTVEFVRFTAEVETKSKVEKVVAKIDNRMIKLKDFKELMRVRAAEYRSDFPNRRVWDAFFATMDEMKPGERPDTVHLWNLPTKWFVPHHLRNDDEIMPSEKILYRIFEKFGSIRHVDIPICDPYRKKMKSHMTGLKNSSFDSTEFFEGYIQFKDYIGFTRAMDALKDMKLVRKDEDGEDMEVEIKVDFDKGKHLSESSIKRREIVRERLVKKAQEKEAKELEEFEEKKKKEEAERQREVDLKLQKETRRKIREEKRKARILKKLEITGSDEINEKIAREEKKLLKVQRKLEAIRILEELFRRVADKQRGNIQKYKEIETPAKDELKKFKNASELEVLTQKEKLHNALNGRTMLKTILSSDHKNKHYSSSSSEISLNDDSGVAPGLRQPHPAEVLHDDPSAWYYGFNDIYYQTPQFFNDYSNRGLYAPRRRAMGPRGQFLGMPGPSRGGVYPRRQRRGYRGGPRGRRYPPDLEEQYRKYFEKFLYENRERRSRSYSPRRSRSRSRSYTRSRSRSRSKRSRSRSKRSRSRSKRSRSRSKRSRSRSKRSRSRSKRSRSRSERRDRERRSSRRDRTRSRTPRTPPVGSRRKSRSRSWSMPRESDKKWSKSPENKK